MLEVRVVTQPREGVEVKQYVRKPSAALVVAIMALIAAISGVAVAAPGPTAHAANGARGPRGYRGYRGFTGPRGPQGSVGPTGPQGPAGVVPAIVTVISPQITLQPGQTSFDVMPNGFQATCPAGDVALGTAFNGSLASTDFVLDFGTFVGGFFSNGSTIAIQVYVQAICGAVPAGSSGQVAADVQSKASHEAQYEAQLKEAQAKVKP